MTSSRRLLARTLLVSALPLAALVPTTSALAANPPGTGQPGASCEDFQATQESPLLVPGFNTAGFAHAATVYAGSDGSASSVHARSTHAVSQYDVACFQQNSRLSR